MVKIQKKRSQKACSSFQKTLGSIGMTMALVGLIFVRRIMPDSTTMKNSSSSFMLSLESSIRKKNVTSSTSTTTTTTADVDAVSSSSSSEPKTSSGATSNVCPISRLSELSQADLFPKADDRHMITPPDGGTLYLICCNSTKGSLNAVLHKAWAPLGVERVIQMIESNYFSTQIPLFRCLHHHPRACQFGLAGDPEYTKKFDHSIQDDPPWLPPGPDHRQNELAVQRYPTGYWTFAGSGPNSRSNQMVITLEPNPYMGGGSPWEVPIGELVGSHSFETIAKWYTGYGEKGPSQKIVRQEGIKSDRIQKEWPLLDYISMCDIVDQQLEEE